MVKRSLFDKLVFHKIGIGQALGYGAWRWYRQAKRPQIKLVQRICAEHCFPTHACKRILFRNFNFEKEVFIHFIQCQSSNYKRTATSIISVQPQESIRQNKGQEIIFNCQRNFDQSHCITNCHSIRWCFRHLSLLKRAPYSHLSHG